MPIIKSDLKGNFNLHFCNEKLRGIFYGKVRAYEVFLTISFLAHAMYLFLGIRLKYKKIDDNIIFFRFRNREAGASIPIMRAMFVNDYQNFIRVNRSNTEQGKFLLRKHQDLDKNCLIRKVA